MRSFVALLLFLLFALLLAAALAYPVWYGLSFFIDQPIHRVMHRIAMLVALIGFIWLFRKWQVTSKKALGYAMERRQFCKQIAMGFVIGIAIMVPLIMMLFGLDVRALRWDWGVADIAYVLAYGAIAGLIVSFVEETFFRGALTSVVERESGTMIAVLLPSLLYAFVHFLSGRLYVPKESIDWSSGFAVFAKLTEKYASPLDLVDSFAVLFVVGILLALVRLRTGAIASCIGLHTAWVCVITTLRRISYVTEESPASWLVGSYDGVIGWGALVWLVAIVVIYTVASRPRLRTAATQ